MERTIEQHIGAAATALSVEIIPELRQARRAAKDEAEQLIAYRRKATKPGQFEAVPLPADPVTAGERIILAESQYGTASHQYQEAYEAAMTDSRRALAEAMRKTTWEYFTPLVQTYNPNEGAYEAWGRPVIEVTRAGLRWDERAEERQRLANEHTEEATYNQLHGHELADSHWALTISLCPEHALADGGKGYSYVPEIKKMMIRGVHFSREDDLDVRVSEQVGLSGLVINQQIIKEALVAIGAVETGESLDKTQLHGTQILIDKSQIDGVLDFVQLLDSLAGEDVFMGEKAEFGDYRQVPIQAEARAQAIENQSAKLTDYIVNLARRSTDHVWAAAQIEQMVNDIVHGAARVNPQIAREAFDEKTASGYAQALVLEKTSYARAEMLRLEVQNNAPPAAYCGAGSCGLVRASSAESRLASILGLSGESIIRDTERTCPHCAAKKVLYDNRGNKACASCRFRQIRGKTTAGRKPAKAKKPAKRKKKVI